MLNIMGMTDTNPKDTPMTHEITDLTPLPDHLHKLFMTGVGCVGWCVNTVRMDAAFAHSRIAQHMAKPTVGAWEALLHLMKYFRGTSKACIWQSLDAPDSVHGWRFYCDSDFAGNNSDENKRRSQNGYVALQGSAPVLWGSLRFHQSLLLTLILVKHMLIFHLEQQKCTLQQTLPLSFCTFPILSPKCTTSISQSLSHWRWTILQPNVLLTTQLSSPD